MIQSAIDTIKALLDAEAGAGGQLENVDNIYDHAYGCENKGDIFLTVEIDSINHTSGSAVIDVDIYHAYQQRSDLNAARDIVIALTEAVIEILPTNLPVSADFADDPAGGGMAREMISTEFGTADTAGGGKYFVSLNKIEVAV